MSKNKQFIIPFAAALITSVGALVSCGGESESVSIEVKAVPLYAAASATQVSTVGQTPLAFKPGQDMLPYTTVESMLDPSFPVKTEFSGHVVTYSNSNFTITVDADKDAITVSDLGNLLEPRTPGKHHLCGIGDFTVADDSSSSVTGAKAVTFDLAKYDMDVIYYEEGEQKLAFIPLAPLNAIMYGGRGIINYNGTSLFMGTPAVLIDSMTGKLTPAGETYYGGAFSSLTSYPEYFVKYNYNSIAFTLDHFFGLAEEEKMYDTRAFCKSKGYEANLLSTDPKKISEGLGQLIYGGLDEDHNSVVSSCFPAKGYMLSTVDSTKSLRAMYRGERGKKMDASDALLAEKKAAALKTLGVQTYPAYQHSGDTSMIYFNAFVASAYKNNTGAVAESDVNSTFGVFYNGFKKAVADGAKNVIINIADNVGGDASALLQTLGFLGKGGRVHTESKYRVDGSTSQEYYQIDTNLDGLYDANDGYVGKFDNIYILQSYSAFSCGNALPYWAKEQGLAKLIGTTTGGGNAVVMNVLAPSGDALNFSGNTILGHVKDGTFTSTDAGAVPDYLLDDASYYFDVAKMADYVKKLA